MNHCGRNKWKKGKMGQKEEGELYEKTSERGGKMNGYVDDDLVRGWMVFWDELNE